MTARRSFLTSEHNFRNLEQWFCNFDFCSFFLIIHLNMELPQNISLTTMMMEPPKRPRTAHNFFFQDERQHLLNVLPVRSAGGGQRRRGAASHGKISFSELGKTIAARWKVISQDRLAYYAALANQDKLRYQKEKKAYKQSLIASLRIPLPTSSPPPPALLSSALAHYLEPRPIAERPQQVVEQSVWDISISHMAQQFDPETIDYLIWTLK